MLRSMTGFGKGEAQNELAHYSLQLKSVNNRFLELGLKLSTELWAFEGEARALLQAKLARGKVDMVWKDLPLPQAQASVGVDLEKAKAYQAALKQLGQDLGLPADLKLESISRLPGVITAETEAGLEGDEAAALRWACLKQALQQALDGMQASREREGAALEKELRSLLDQALAAVDGIEQKSHALQAGFAEKLKKRLGELMERLSPDDPRLVMEVALLVDKADIREELVRFREHVAEFRRQFDLKEAVGKKLDFLSQELLREVNTMGSKSPEASLTQAVVGLKSIVERVKEQILNVE
jgi:uncharacterized protein (TIGR00255 family)